MIENIISKALAYQYIGIDLSVSYSGGRDKKIHVFMNPKGMLLGADWNEEEIIELLEHADKIELGGTFCMSMNHGVVVTKEGKEYFIESKVPQEKNDPTN